MTVGLSYHRYRLWQDLFSCWCLGWLRGDQIGETWLAKNSGFTSTRDVVAGRSERRSEVESLRGARAGHGGSRSAELPGDRSRTMSKEVSTFRLYLMRALYLLNFVLLGLDVLPEVLRHQGAWDPLKGVAFSFWAALSALSGLGVRYPVRMLPLLLLQLFYKLVWLLAVALPMWSTVRSTDLTHAMVAGVVVDLIGIPWRYVVASYVKDRGDKWR